MNNRNKMLVFLSFMFLSFILILASIVIHNYIRIKNPITHELSFSDSYNNENSSRSEHQDNISNDNYLDKIILEHEYDNSTNSTSSEYSYKNSEEAKEFEEYNQPQDSEQTEILAELEETQVPENPENPEKTSEQIEYQDYPELNENEESDKTQEYEELSFLDKVLLDSSNLGDYGRLYFKNMWSVALYGTSVYDGEQTQSIVDKSDSAAIFNFGNLEVIAAHKDQGFDIIRDANIGDLVYIKRNDDIIDSYICAEVVTGTNTESDLITSDGRYVSSMTEYDIVMYTCNYTTWRDVTIVFWKRT